MWYAKVNSSILLLGIYSGHLFFTHTSFYTQCPLFDDLNASFGFQPHYMFLLSPSPRAVSLREGLVT
ncbi:hypothetical protein L209DRAFT_346478 [Thermothelomyces heterothallicus CBS 203.75]